MQLKKINRLSVRTKFLLLIVPGLIGLGVAFHLHSSGAFSPGPLSAMQLRGEPLGGYTSHAEFQQQCTHCHVPIHCVTDTRCQDCHMDVARQRAAGDGLHGRIPVEQCQDCHTEHKGHQADITTFAFVNVDHTRLANFSLINHQVDYQGRPLTCESCHSQDRIARDTLDCLTCHAHQDHEFTARHIETYGASCIDCHDGQDRMAGFDHNQFFALQGAHAAADCRDCHPNQTYAGTPGACAACHREPDVHREQFGADCARCHTAEAWTPAYLTRHIFPLEHGAPEQLACQTCHLQAYTTYSCDQCHIHQPAEIEASHRAEGIIEISNCAACHPTGRPGEADRLRQECESTPDAGKYTARLLPTLEP
ncbi:MAG: hypothetical protein FOGNACKC_03540 [Anaerolineae bacterium]|nr:hypothetical protein [Anaerolineae bacterium]